MWELAILASQRACMRVVVHGLAAVLLEFPVHPAPVPDADSIPNVDQQTKTTPQGCRFCLLVETATPAQPRCYWL
jgi:hypothetical protein